MSQDAPTRPKSNTAFWRACRYLYPHRRIVIISICCALFVGAAFTSGLGTMLPILKVLIEGQTVQGWANRLVVEQRLDVKLADAPGHVRLLSVDPTGPAGRAGLEAGQEIHAALPSSKTAAANRQEITLAALAKPGPSVIIPIQIVGGPQIQIATQPLPWHLRTLRNIAMRFPRNPVASIGIIFGFITLLAVIANIFRFFQEYLSDKAAILAVNDLRRKLYDHVLHIPMEFFGLKGSSDVTSRLVQDAQGLQGGFKTILGQSIQEPIKAAMAFTLALIVSWKLTLFIVLFAPLMVAIIRKFGKKMRRASRKALQKSSSMLGQIEGTLIGIRVVKAAGAERFERRRYSRIMDKLVYEQLKMSRIDALSTPTMETLTLIVVGLVVLFAAYLVLVARALEPSSFILVMACLMGIGESLRRVGKLNNVLNKSAAAAGRIFETLDVPVERRRQLTPAARAGRTNLASGNGHLSESGLDSGHANPNSARELERAVKLPPIAREIRFEKVTFAYPNATVPALDNVNLIVPKGQGVAIVGRNGSGKTTLAALLPRFYDPQQGRILIDGVDVRHATLRSLRGQIGIVTQDSVIFPGSIADNIAYGIPNPDRNAVIDAAKRAFAHDFIMEKSEGYDAPLDGLGGQLSGGQKQRLCIARAIFRASPILILDEATSQVDAESENLIQQAIESLMRQRTTFIIAHRFSTILSADTIVVMDRGQIVGQGRHEDLLNTCPTYQQLYERQLVAVPAAG